MSSIIKEECNICCNLSSSTLKCGSCDTLYCIKCSKTYLLTVPEAQCMGCKKQWDERFIRDHFPKTWVNGEYKQHIKKMLLNREKSYIPDTMRHVNNRVMELENYVEKLETKNIEMSFDVEINKLKVSFSKLKGRNELKNRDEINKINVMIIEITEAREKALIERSHVSQRLIYDNMIHGAKRDVREMPKKCPVDDCKGYLKGDVCQVCTTHICGK